MANVTVPASRLDYIHRLITAKLVIQRLRLARSLKNWSSRKPGDTASQARMQGGQEGRYASRVFVFSTLLLGLACTALTAYWLGSRRTLDVLAAAPPLTTAPAMPPASVKSATSNLHPSASASSAPFVQSSPSSPSSPSAPDVGSEQLNQQADVNYSHVHIIEQAKQAAENSRKEQARLQAELITALKAELEARMTIDSLRQTVVGLREHIETLEGETMALESELLERDIALVEAEKAQSVAGVERRVIYNITNIPVGGHVSDSDLEYSQSSVSYSDTQSVPYQSSIHDPYQTGIAFGIEPAEAGSSADDNDYEKYWQSNGGEVEQWQGDQYLADTMERVATDVKRLEDISGSADSVPVGQQSFYGPAPDLYEDLMNPGIAVTPYQQQTYESDQPAINDRVQ